MKHLNKVCIAHISTCILLLALTDSGFSNDSMGRVEVMVQDFYSKDPIGNVHILISPGNNTGTSDASGIALFEGITPYRNYQIDAEADGYFKRSAGFISVNAGEETLATIPMKQQSTIAGEVAATFLFGRFAFPVRNAVIILGTISGSEPFSPIRSVKTDGDGFYAFSNVDEGTYHMIAMADGYVKSEMVEVEAEAGKESTFDFNLKWRLGRIGTKLDIEITGSSGNGQEQTMINGQRVYLDASKSTGFNEFYWINEVLPEGATSSGSEYYPGTGEQSSFIASGLGDYTVRLLTVDNRGVVKSTTASFTSLNVAPTAVPSVIPGPSELPYLYDNNQVYTTSSGSAAAQTGETVYLRGFAVDLNLLSPEEFNPDAPCFDIYGTKNGNFSASIFSYIWTLMDEKGNDLSSLLKPSSASENVYFKIPDDAEPGDSFTASLTVTDELDLPSQPEQLVLTVAETVNDAACAECHSDNAAGYVLTKHAQVEGGAGCQDCHGPGREHVSGNGIPKLTVNNWSGVCGQCHKEFAELQKANHSDPLAFGYYEPTDGRLTSCYKCHYTSGYIGAVESENPFHKFRYGSDTLDEIPMDTPNISCSVCHDPHSSGDHHGLRTGSAGASCDTCHREKWQNAIMEGLSNEFKNGYHYPEEDYTAFLGEKNPHRTDDKCVLCHMNTAQDSLDENGVRRIGGHTLRMRYFGADDIPRTEDDVLNIKVCQTCHEGLTDFDRNGVQTETKNLLDTLSELLKDINHDFLPPSQPGKCARCHKGGTVPFLDDPDNVLENAYTNYKLILHDRSWGIHNPGYINRLLEDSINSIKEKYNLNDALREQLEDTTLEKG